MKEKKLIIHIDEELDATQRSWLATKLEEEKGILSAWFPGDDPHRLTIRYEQEHFSHTTLLDTIAEHGFHGRIVGDDDPGA
jgi:hypothetical protein